MSEQSGRLLLNPCDRDQSRHPRIPDTDQDVDAAVRSDVVAKHRTQQGTFFCIVATAERLNGSTGQPIRTVIRSWSSTVLNTESSDGFTKRSSTLVVWDKLLWYWEVATIGGVGSGGGAVSVGSSAFPVSFRDGTQSGSH